MFGFIKKLFIGLLSVCTLVRFSRSLPPNYKRPIKCVSLNNHPRQARKTLVNINSEGTLFYSFTVSVNKSGGSYNTIDDPCARVCVLNKTKNMDVKTFNLVSGVNEIKFLVQYKSRGSKCRLNESVCNSEQKWNHNECRCECKELDDWDFCKNDYMWNPSRRNCECNKACKSDEYLDIKN